MRATPVPTPQTAATPALVELAPVLPGEDVLYSGAGRGGQGVLFKGTTAPKMVLYGVCRGGGSMVLEDKASDLFMLVVPCDGVVSRSQLFLEPGRPLILGAGGRRQQWKILLTARRG